MYMGLGHHILRYCTRYISNHWRRSHYRRRYHHWSIIMMIVNTRLEILVSEMTHRTPNGSPNILAIPLRSGRDRWRRRRRWWWWWWRWFGFFSFGFIFTGFAWSVVASRHQCGDTSNGALCRLRSCSCYVGCRPNLLLHVENLSWWDCGLGCCLGSDCV